MARKKRAPEIDVASLQPDELNELKSVMREFIKRLTNIDNEMSLLRESRKELLEEYTEKLDTKMLQRAMKVVKLESEVPHRDAYDRFKELLEDDFVNDLVD